MIVIGRPEDAEAWLSNSAMRCPGCGGTLAKWGYGRQRTVRSLGSQTVTVRPQRTRCRDVNITHIVLPTALQPRRADTTEVIGTALAHKAHGLGYRRIAVRMGRAESTVRRWLRRASGAHLQWLYQQGVRRLLQLAPDAFNEISYSGNQLRHALTVLAAAAFHDRQRFGFAEPPWTLIGMYTQGRLLAPPPRS